MTLLYKSGIVIIAMIVAIISSKQRIKWTTEEDPIEFQVLIKIIQSIIQSIMSILLETLIKLFIAYKFPILFVSWVIITDPLTIYLINLVYKRLKESLKDLFNTLSLCSQVNREPILLQ